MAAITSWAAKIFGADYIINQQKSNSILQTSSKCCTKSKSSYEISVMLQYYYYDYTNNSLHSSITLSHLRSSHASHVIRCLPFSKSEEGLRIETTGTKRSVHVKFQLEKECQFGDHFFMVGDDPILGSWDPSYAIPFNWSQGHLWTLVLEMPIEMSIKYKFLLKKSSGDILWQPGQDRIFRPWETKNVIIVSDEWGNAEAQKISENEEVIGKTMVELSSSDLPKLPLEDPVPITVNSDNRVSGSDKNPNAENHTVIVNNGAYAKENTSSSATKKGKSSNINVQKKVATRKSDEGGVRVDKGSAEIEDKDDGNLVTYDEGRVLVPGLTLPWMSSIEVLVKERGKSVLDETLLGSDGLRRLE